MPHDLDLVMKLHESVLRQFESPKDLIRRALYGGSISPWNHGPCFHEDCHATGCQGVLQHLGGDEPERAKCFQEYVDWARGKGHYAGKAWASSFTDEMALRVLFLNPAILIALCDEEGYSQEFVNDAFVFEYRGKGKKVPGCIWRKKESGSCKHKISHTLSLVCDFMIVPILAKVVGEVGLGCTSDSLKGYLDKVRRWLPLDDLFPKFRVGNFECGWVVYFDTGLDEDTRAAWKVGGASWQEAYDERMFVSLVPMPIDATESPKDRVS